MDDVTIAGTQNADPNKLAVKGFFERYMFSSSKPSEVFVKNRLKHNPNFRVMESMIDTNLGNGRRQQKIHYCYLRRKNDICVTRLQSVNATIGERFYLRLILLHHARRSHLEARTVNGKEYPSFLLAAHALGLLADFDEAFYCLQEAVLYEQDPASLRRLFVILLKEGWPLAKILLVEPTDTNFFEYDGVRAALISDFKIKNNNSDRRAFNELLLYIHDYISTNTSNTMETYGLEQPEDVKTELQRERHLYHDAQVQQDLAQEFENMRTTWTLEFEAAFDMVQLVQQNGGGVCVIKGGGGVGKTYLTKGLVLYFRSRGLIVRIAAPTALAATLYEGGNTMHELFKLNIITTQDEEYTSFVDKHPQRIELLRACKVIIFDEIFNVHLDNYNAAITALQQICKSSHKTAGKTIVMCGDPKQIPPVVINASGETATVAKSIVQMRGWRDIPKMELTIDQRVQHQEFADFIRQVANGDVPTHRLAKNDIPLIKLPCHLVRPFIDQQDALQWFMPVSTLQRDCNGKGAILCADNERVDALNAVIQKRRNSPTTTLCSATNIKDAPDGSGDLMCAPEVLYGLTTPSVPPHLLVLAVGDIVFLQRNLDKRVSLTNNTRLRTRDQHQIYQGADPR